MKQAVSQGRTSSLYDRLDYHNSMGMMYISVRFQMNSQMPATSIHSAMHIFTRNAYVGSVPQKLTWCIAGTKTCLEGGVLKAMAARLVVHQFI